MGQWTEAIKWAEKAVDLATDDASRKEYASRVDLFEKRHPLRVTPGMDEKMTGDKVTG